MDTTKDKSVIQIASILMYDLDIIGIAETHLRDDTFPQLDGYTAFTHNRPQQHRRARCGSGGVCLLVKNYINELYNVSILDNKTEDILWVKFISKVTLCHINVCVCYLPPDGSSRHIDPSEFFSNLLSQIYLYQVCGPYLLCGDFNARCGDQQDFIEGVDEVQHREIIDYRKNGHGDLLVDFLINSNCVMLNGRCLGTNDYTSVSTKGLAVVDYAIINQYRLHQCKNMRVVRAQELFRQTELLGRVNPEHNISDHSMLVWDFQLSVDEYTDGGEFGTHFPSVLITKYDINEVPELFMCDEDAVQNVNSIFDEPDGEIAIENMNDVYSKFCHEVHRNMALTLPVKHIVINGTERKDYYRKRKPWWTNELSELWKIRCAAEKLYCKSDNDSKRELRQQFLSHQRNFDDAVRCAKRCYWSKEQEEILSIYKSNAFWKKMGSVGMSTKPKKNIPWEVVLADGSTSTNYDDVMSRWKHDFELLLNYQNHQTIELCDLPELPVNLLDTSSLDATITIEEVSYALLKANKGKALGNDQIPLEVINNQTCTLFLLQLFNFCFTSCTVPQEWSRGIISPILKDVNADPRDPLNYRGITITSLVYKIYCSILNHRLSHWIESNNILCDEQNGFRSGRCTIDHVGSLTSIIETRMKKKSDTFVAFIDFSKAYDRINRQLLWYKLSRLGISDQFIHVLKSLYSKVQCTAKINGFITDWFNVSVGLKQGCILSPVLFNAFMDDLVQMIREQKKGVTYGDVNVSILLYADDIVLLSNCEEGLQSMLVMLGEWCSKWGLTINGNKSKVMHFRSQSVDKTVFPFTCRDETLEIVSQYKYLGLILTEHLDFLEMAKSVAKSASRALGFLICKDKALGGMPFECFTKCYNSLVQPVIDYGSLYGVQTVIHV